MFSELAQDDVYLFSTIDTYYDQLQEREPEEPLISFLCD